MRLDQPGSLISRILTIDHLAQQERAQLCRSLEDGWIGEWRSKLGDLFVTGNGRAVSLGSVWESDHADNDKDMEELGLDGIGDKGLVSIDKDDAYNVVANMTLALDLLAIDGVVGQKGRHVVHDLEPFAPSVIVRILPTFAYCKSSCVNRKYL